MAKRTWKFNIDGRSHLVELKHGPYSGTHKIWLDSNLIVSDRKLLEQGSQYRFEVAGKDCEVGVVTNGVSFDYYLLADGQPIAAEKAGRKPSKMLKRVLESKQYWFQLGEAAGLKYDIPAKRHGFILNRLIGTMEGFLVVLHSVTDPRMAQAAIEFTIRCLPNEDLKALAQNIKRDPALKQLGASLMSVEQRSVWFRVVSLPDKGISGQLAERLKDIVRAASRHIRPTNPENCEGERCRARPYPNPGKLVLLNDVPYMLCDTCSKDIPAILEKDKQAASNSLSTIFMAVILASIGVFLGGVIWAVVGVYLNLVASVTGAVILFGILKLMEIAGAKTNLWVIMIAGLLSFASVILGEYFGILMYVMKEYAAPLSLDLILFGIEVILDDPVYLLEPLFYAALGIFYVGFAALRNQSRQMKALTAPTVEQVD